VYTIHQYELILKTELYICGDRPLKEDILIPIPGDSDLTVKYEIYSVLVNNEDTIALNNLNTTIDEWELNIKNSKNKGKLVFKYGNKRKKSSICIKILPLG